MTPVINKLTLNWDLVSQLLDNFISDGLSKFGFKKAIIGLSGGIDSALSCALAAKALGPQNVVAIKMPYKQSSPESISHANEVIKQLKVQSEEISITEQVDAYFVKRKNISQLQKGNKMARERMSILYDISNDYKALVIGTSNKTELLLGYGTQFGDMASAINPLGDLYKTQVFEFSKFLELPESVINKKPSADLWENQTDEEDLGYSYEKIDSLLYYLIDERYSEKELEDKGFEKTFIEVMSQRIKNNQYKRRPPVIAKLSKRTIESDFLYPRDWGV